MNFEDEPYVRKYTRKTLTWKQLGWEGRAVKDAMLGEFDPAGVFEIRGDAAECISLVTEIPIDAVRVGLERLVHTETWIVSEHAVTWPNYEEGQNCTRSDRLRQRKSRQDRAARASGVTPSHKRSRAVTAGHQMSPSPPSFLPPILDPPVVPHGDTRADPEPSEVVIPGLVRVTAATGVSRVVSVPCEDPPQAYLDEAVMRGVSTEQARSTWEHYWGEGLPERGVERLHDWLLKRAKERQNRMTRSKGASPAPTSRPTKTFADAMKECP